MRKRAGGKEAEAVKEALFGGETPKEPGGRRAEKKLLADLDAELGKGLKGSATKSKPRLAEVGLPSAAEIKDAVTVWEGADESAASDSDEEPTTGFWDTPAKAKKSKKGKASKKSSNKTKKDKKKPASKKDKKKKKRASSSASSSSDSSSSSSSVFRVGENGNDRISQARLIQWAEDHPGATALQLLRKMKNVVREDGEKWRRRVRLPRWQRSSTCGS